MEKAKRKTLLIPAVCAVKWFTLTRTQKEELVGLVKARRAYALEELKQDLEDEETSELGTSWSGSGTASSSWGKKSEESDGVERDPSGQW